MKSVLRETQDKLIQLNIAVDPMFHIQRKLEILRLLKKKLSEPDKGESEQYLIS